MATFPRTESAAVDKQVTAAQASSTPAAGSIVASMMSQAGEILPASLAVGAATANLAPGDVKHGQIGRTVANKSGGTLAAGTLVYCSGYDTGLSAPTIAKADAKSTNKRAQWIVSADILNNAAGLVVKQWLSPATLNTNAAAAVGSPVYGDTSNGTVGGWIVAAPAYRNDQVGWVVVKSASVGQIYFDLDFLATVLAGNQGDITAGSIGAAQIAATAITTALLAANAVTTAKLALLAVDNTILAAGAALANLGGVQTGVSAAVLAAVVEPNAKTALGTIHAALVAAGVVTAPS